MSKELPFTFARKNNLIAIRENEQLMTLWITEKTPLESIIEVQRVQPNIEHHLVKVSLEELEQKLQTIYTHSNATSMDNMDNLDIGDLASFAAKVSEAEDLLDSSDDAPIIKLLNAIMAEAIRTGASDIHIEPFEAQLRIRFRIDGQLKTVLTPQVELADMLASRIKVLAKLDIAEKRLPQDGRIATKLGGRAVDLRISTIPSSFGERVVMRLLDKSSGRLNLIDLGLPTQQLNILQNMLKKPHGILLVTGPTGSGKTTTLYAALSRLNSTQNNIMTIEDPVEYNIEGINQTQVNAKTKMSFAKGLRAILRQDPDIVMIGEIRDIETAQISVQASLTGHLVLSTLHTNTAIGAISRLRDMGVEPFLLSSSLLGVMAQRLVRKLCQNCKQKATTDTTENQFLGVDNIGVDSLIYHAKGCDNCNFTGYKGRIGIYELIEIDDTLRKMIYSDTSELEMAKHAHKKVNSIQQSGIKLVLNGSTSLEELLRVTQS